WFMRRGVEKPQTPDPPPPPPSWPWGSPPPLGSLHGIGQAFNDAGNGQVATQVYSSWLGRPANIAGAWALMGQGYNDTWDHIAGGSGNDDTTFAGQLGGLSWSNIGRGLTPSYWPVTAPLVLMLSGVPVSHQNVKSGNSWTRPGIWQEVRQGNFDIYYQRLFRRLAYRCGVSGRDPKTVVIRWCWEMSGTWYPHSVGPDKSGFIEAWKRTMGIMRASVSAVLGAGKSFMIEFSPDTALRFGSESGERLWNIYPGDDVVDIVATGIHDRDVPAAQGGHPINVQADWDKLLRYPASAAGQTVEGLIDWFDFGVSRGKWVGTSEIESNYLSHDTYFHGPTNMQVMWTTGFEPLRQRYAGKFLYFIYLWNSYSRMNGDRANWSQPYKTLYGA
ncbi:MAG: hypothetical protein QXD32_07610, partial [Nitrososphaerota archaeon]